MIKKHSDEKHELYLFTGAKQIIGDYTGSGHVWLIKGVHKYDAIRKKLMSEKDIIQDYIFECNLITEKTLGLTELLNMDETEDLANQSLLEIDINDILASGKLENV